MTTKKRRVSNLLNKPHTILKDSWNTHNTHQPFYYNMLLLLYYYSTMLLPPPLQNEKYRSYLIARRLCMLPLKICVSSSRENIPVWDQQPQWQGMVGYTHELRGGMSNAVQKAEPRDGDWTCRRRRAGTCFILSIVCASVSSNRVILLFPTK